MEAIDVTAYALHTIFAGVWTGAVVFLTIAVVSPARDGRFKATSLQSLGSNLKWFSRVSALVLFVSGSHMAAARYTGESLTGSTGGHLVLGMLTLWLVLIATVEIATARLDAGTHEQKVRKPARESWPFFLGATVTAILLLLVAGLLGAHNVGLF